MSPGRSARVAVAYSQPGSMPYAQGWWGPGRGTSEAAGCRPDGPRPAGCCPPGAGTAEAAGRLLAGKPRMARAVQGLDRPGDVGSACLCTPRRGRCPALKAGPVAGTAGPSTPPEGAPLSGLGVGRTLVLIGGEPAPQEVSRGEQRMVGVSVDGEGWLVWMRQRVAGCGVATAMGMPWSVQRRSVRRTAETVAAPTAACPRETTKAEGWCSPRSRSMASVRPARCSVVTGSWTVTIRMLPSSRRWLCRSMVLPVLGSRQEQAPGGQTMDTATRSRFAVARVDRLGIRAPRARSALFEPDSISPEAGGHSCGYASSMAVRRSARIRAKMRPALSSSSPTPWCSPAAGGQAAAGGSARSGTRSQERRTGWRGRSVRG